MKRVLVLIVLIAGAAGLYVYVRPAWFERSSRGRDRSWRVHSGAPMAGR